MSKRGSIESLNDIKEAIKRIEIYIGKTDYEEFLRDIKTQDAIIRNLEIMGEAAKNFSADFKKKYRDIEWKKISGLRDKVIHDYFGVDWDIVWDVIKNRMPALLEQVENILNKMTG